jgi:DNA-binding MarR family transcriptional regulator
MNAGVSSSGVAPALPVVPPDLAGQVDLRVLSAIRRIIRSFDLYSRELAAKARITSPQLVCLLAVAERGKTTATIMGREVFLSPSTIVGILDRLEAKGLVRRERDGNDRRVVSVSLTEEGSRLARSAPSPLQDTLTEALRVLPGEEQIKIAESLERVVTLMETHRLVAASTPEVNVAVSPDAEAKQ